MNFRNKPQQMSPLQKQLLAMLLKGNNNNNKKTLVISTFKNTSTSKLWWFERLNVTFIFKQKKAFLNGKNKQVIVFWIYSEIVYFPPTYYRPCFLFLAKSDRFAFRYRYSVFVTILFQQKEIFPHYSTLFGRVR